MWKLIDWSIVVLDLCDQPVINLCDREQSLVTIFFHGCQRFVKEKQLLDH